MSSAEYASSSAIPAAKRKRHPDHAQPGEHERSSGERERERDEPGETARLGERHGVGEPGEERRHEQERQHRKTSSEDERRPPATGAGHGERDREQGRDHDRPCARDRLGSEPKAVAEDIELGRVVGDSAARSSAPGR